MRRIGQEFTDLTRWMNPIVRGWIQYYGAFYKSALYRPLLRINAYLMRWIRKKYIRLRAFTKALACWRGVTTRYPRMFVHWAVTRSVW